MREIRDSMNRIRNVENPKSYFLVKCLKVFKNKIIPEKRVMLFEDIGVAFYHLPKSAGSSIMSSLKKVSSWKKVSDEEVDDYYIKVVFTRNHEEKLKSAYNFMIKQEIFQKRYGINKKTSFDEWIYRCKDDWHLKGFFELYGDIEFDFIGKYEDLEKDWKRLCKIIGHSELKLDKLNITKEIKG